jgi:glycosyltransferase involved in cell wall biosynthesis
MTEPLGLGYVVEDYPTFVVDEIAQLRKLGARVTLFSAFRPEPQPDPKKDAYRREAAYFPGRSGIVWANLRCLLRRPLAYLSTAWILLRQGESLRLLLLGACFAERIARDRIRHMHGTFGTRTTALAFSAARLAGIPYSFTTHAYDVFKPNPSLAWKTTYAEFMRTISRFNKAYIEATYPGVDGAKVRVVYLGVDTALFEPPAARGARSDGVSIVSVGDLIQQKGHGYLIRACGRLASRGLDFRCEIVGAGADEDVFRREAGACGAAEHVELRGRLDHTEVRRLLEAADVFALACIDMRTQGAHVDGIPVAIMEAMAMGLPVVSTTVGGIPELVDATTGFLVSERDEEALADALARLIEDSKLRDALGRGARARIEERFDLATNTRRLAEMFAEHSAPR